MHPKGSGAGGSLLPLQQFYRWERERANDVFLTQPFGGGDVRRWTWRQAAHEVRRVAGYLKSQDLPPGSSVAILSKNCAWWMMADLAIWMAGHVTVPVYPSLRASTVRQILEHSDSRLCFIGATDEKDVASAGIPRGISVIRFPGALSMAGPEWTELVAQAQEITGNPVRGADDLATIFYTSGTTGAPKGVMHRFGAFDELARAMVKRLGLDGSQRVLSYLPLAHILERGGLELPAVLLGWQVFFTEGPATFVADVRRARPTLFYAVPRLLVKLQQGVFEKIPREKLDRLLHVPVVASLVRWRILKQLGFQAVRYAFCGGAPLAPDILLWYRNLGLNLMEGYGLTEAMITHLPGPGHVQLGYVGNAFDGVEERQADNGELLLKSAMNMIGYYKDPLGTGNAFTDEGFFRTGDIVEFSSDRQVKIVGRIKEQFKTSKGKFVIPAPIETKLMAHRDIESCCLIGAGQPRPFAVVVLSPEAFERCSDPVMRTAFNESMRQRLDAVNAELDPHERIAFVAVTNEPWTTANGMITPTLKLKRSSLEVHYLPYVDMWKIRNQPVVWQDEGSSVLFRDGGEAA